jgi:antitoxin component YwqK of YwqJK toxin-antitoxin module
MNRFAFVLLIATACAQSAPENAATTTAPLPSAKQNTSATEGHQVIQTPDGGRMEGELRDGVREGTWASYFKDGGIRSRITYEHGVEQGETRVYHASGMPYYTGHYRNGLSVGEWVFHDVQGNPVKRVVYDSLGVEVRREDLPAR